MTRAGAGPQRGVVVAEVPPPRRQHRRRRGVRVGGADRRGQRDAHALGRRPGAHRGAPRRGLRGRAALGARRLRPRTVRRSARALAAVGHRVVHGGDLFSEPAVVDDRLLATVEDLVPLAPLHNPANLEGLRVARRLFPDVPQVAVFDTAFHQTMPEHAYTYAVPVAWREKHRIRRYGFHGTSYAFVSRRAAELLGRPVEDTNLVVLHLGNGASAAAVRGGRSVDTSMGLTPLEGLVMGTRSGDLDPAIHGHLHRELGWSLDEIDRALYRDSGLLGLSGRQRLPRADPSHGSRRRGGQARLRRLRLPRPQVRRRLLRRARRAARRRLHRRRRPAQRRAAGRRARRPVPARDRARPAAQRGRRRGRPGRLGRRLRGRRPRRPHRRGVGDRPPGARGRARLALGRSSLAPGTSKVDVSALRRTMTSGQR